MRFPSSYRTFKHRRISLVQREGDHSLGLGPHQLSASLAWPSRPAGRLNHTNRTAQPPSSVAPFLQTTMRLLVLRSVACLEKATPFRRLCAFYGRRPLCGHTIIWPTAGLEDVGPRRETASTPRRIGSCIAPPRAFPEALPPSTLGPVGRRRRLRRCHWGKWSAHRPDHTRRSRGPRWPLLARRRSGTRQPSAHASRTGALPRTGTRGVDRRRHPPPRRAPRHRLPRVVL